MTSTIQALNKHLRSTFFDLFIYTPSRGAVTADHDGHAATGDHRGDHPEIALPGWPPKIKTRANHLKPINTMARMTGITGKLRGKYGNAVFRVRRGTQVMSQYNPDVANPSTTKQVAARGKMKLMAQLSSIYATVIAIPREGSRTPRNLFVQKNYPYAYANGNNVEIDLPQVQLTKSNREMDAFTVSRSSGDGITCALLQAAKHSRVVYVIVAKNANNALRVFDTAVVENDAPDEENTFSVKMNYTSEAIVVYAYAIDDNNNNAKAAFGNITAPTAEQIAQLMTNRSLTLSDYTISATSGAYLEVGTNDAVSEDHQDGGGSTGALEPPTIGGQSPFSEFTDVTISGPDGATLYYTLDGTNPNPESPVYSAPIHITANTTVKAVAVVGERHSRIVSRAFQKTSAPVVVVAPTISGTTPFSPTTQVSISAEAGATIFYTIDGSTPTESSRAYSQPFTLDATTTVKAIARLQNTNSAVSTKVFTLSNGGDNEYE